MWELHIKIFYLSINVDNDIIVGIVNTVRQSLATLAFLMYFVIRYRNKNFNILVKLIKQYKDLLILTKIVLYNLYDIFISGK